MTWWSSLHCNVTWHCVLGQHKAGLDVLYNSRLILPCRTWASIWILCWELCWWRNKWQSIADHQYGISGRISCKSVDFKILLQIIHQSILHVCFLSQIQDANDQNAILDAVRCLIEVVGISVACRFHSVAGMYSGWNQFQSSLGRLIFQNWTFDRACEYFSDNISQCLGIVSSRGDSPWAGHSCWWSDKEIDW